MATTRTSRLHSKQLLSLDMTPMADIAFLLIAFFMLTSHFLYLEPAVVKVPKTSWVGCQLPDIEPLSLTIANDGRLFFDMDGKLSRMNLLQQMGEKYGVAFNEKQLANFAAMGSFGMDIRQLSSYLALGAKERGRVRQVGIPMQQFAAWLAFARKINPKLRVFIKADEATSYPTIKAVIDVLQEHDIHRMRLVTHIEPYES